MWTHVAVANEMLIQQHLSYSQDGRFEGGRQHFFSITLHSHTVTFFFYYHSNAIDLVERAGTISESEETNVRTKQEKLNGRIEGEGQGECNTTTCGGALTLPPSHTLRTSC